MGRNGAGGVIVAALACALCLASPALAQDPPPRDGGTCATESGPLRLTQAWARPPGGEWEDPLAKLCVLFHYHHSSRPAVPPDAGPPPDHGPPPMALVSFRTRAHDSPDLSSVYPPGTLFSLVVESSGPQPLVAMGTFADPRARMDGGRVTLQAATAPVTPSYWSGFEMPRCSPPSMTLRSALQGVILFDPGDSSITAERLRRDRGAYVGTNAEQIQARPAGDALEIYLSGCGDADPATLDGFYTAFIPARGAGQLGIGSWLLALLSDREIDAVMKLTDNGRPVRASDFEVASAEEVALRPAPGVEPAPAGEAPAGILVDYHLSFSPHVIRATANRGQVRVARRCRARKGRLKVRRRGARKTLVCVPRRSRRR